MVEEVDVRLKSCLNVEHSVRLLLETLESETQLVKEATPSKLSGETPLEIYTFREEIPIDVDKGMRGNKPVTMVLDRGMNPQLIPPMSPIYPMVRPKGLPIVVPQNL